MTDPTRPLALLPEHMAALASTQPTGLVGAQIYRSGRFDEDGFIQYGRLEFLANCGLVEFIAQVGKSEVQPGDVWLYYFLTEQGRVLLKWRAGVDKVAPISGRRAARRTTIDPDHRPGAHSTH